MANEIIKETAKGNGVKLWQIADKLGIYDGNFSRKLRHELAAEEQIRIIGIIHEIAKEKNAND